MLYEQCMCVHVLYVYNQNIYIYISAMYMNAPTVVWILHPSSIYTEHKAFPLFLSPSRTFIIFIG